MPWHVAALHEMLGRCSRCNQLSASYLLLWSSSFVSRCFVLILWAGVTVDCRHEIVGIVTDVGSEVQNFKPGDRAGVGTYVDTCRTCNQCKAGNDTFCPKLVFTYNSQHYDGMPAQGGYSTHIVIDEL